MIEYNLNNLWPTPIYNATIDFNDDWNNNVKNFNFQKMKSKNALITSDKNVLNNNCFDNLKKELQSHINNYVYNVLKVKDNLKFQIINSWINIHKPGQSSGIHSHSNSLLSGVFYFNDEEDIGGIRFYPNNFNLFYKSISINYKENNYINAEYISYKNKKGTVLLFPSHVDHSVEENKSNVDRYSLAFNIFVKGKLIVDDEFELNI